MCDTYETYAKGIRILPGQWRPHFAFEQIAWVSPPWPSPEYVWLDFPEAIFTNIGILYLSHVNPPYPALFPDLPRVPWEDTGGGLRFERTLPNGVAFGGGLEKNGETVVDMTLWLHNGGGEPLREIQLQTCAFLRGITEFGAFTQDNKFVHTAEQGWTSFETARTSGAPESGRYGLGWRGGPKKADLPVLATVSAKAERLVAMTWLKHTNSLVCNPQHPCMHADPFFPDLDPGERAEIHGKLMFFEGSLDDFGEWYAANPGCSL